MEAKEFQTADFNDIIFEGRNKSYGAYLLRNLYPQNLSKAAVIGGVLFVLLVCIPLIASILSELLPEEKMVEVNVELMQPPPIDETKPPPPPPPPPVEPPPPVKPTVKFVPPKIVKDEMVKDEPPPPTIEELKEADPDKKTQEGNKSGVDMSQVEDDGKGKEPPPPPAAEEPPPPPPPPDDKIYDLAVIEQQPSFPDGEAAMFKYLRDNMDYPAMARENRIEGTVYIEFVIAKDGSVTSAIVKRGIGGGCNEEALRVVKSMPKWSPGKQQGNPVKVKFILPVKFKLG